MITVHCMREFPPNAYRCANKLTGFYNHSARIRRPCLLKVNARRTSNDPKNSDRVG